MSKENEYNFEPLNIGSSGAIVLMVQKTLNSIGYQLDNNGVFDRKMEDIIKNFQKERNFLPIDGIIGIDTMEEIDRIFISKN